LGPEKAKALTDHIKLWADPWYNQPGEIKGGVVPLKYTTLVVTSNYSLEECFDYRDRPAMVRRFEVIVKNL